jgi:hypothetical protein
MADTETHTGAQGFDAAFGQVRELNEQFLSTARKAGTLYIDSYEKTLDQAIQLELKLAGITKQEWLRNLMEAQADYARGVGESYTTAVRNLLK